MIGTDRMRVTHTHIHTLRKHTFNDSPPDTHARMHTHTLREAQEVLFWLTNKSLLRLRICQTGRLSLRLCLLYI